MPVTGKSHIKPPTLGGTDLERIENWIWKIETYLIANHVPYEHYFFNAMYSLSAEAENFAFSLVEKKGTRTLDWEEFKCVMRERFDKTVIRADLLRQKLEGVVYGGTSKMMEYCTAFRNIEQQVHDMNFNDKLRTFLKPLPPGAKMHIRLLNLAAKDMAQSTWELDNGHTRLRP